MVQLLLFLHRHYGLFVMNSCVSELFTITTRKSKSNTQYTQWTCFIRISLSGILCFILISKYYHANMLNSDNENGKHYTSITLVLQILYMMVSRHHCLSTSLQSYSMAPSCVCNLKLEVIRIFVNVNFLNLYFMAGTKFKMSICS